MLLKCILKCKSSAAIVILLFYDAESIAMVEAYKGSEI
jgi:hypothetical protein